MNNRGDLKLVAIIGVISLAVVAGCVIGFIDLLIDLFLTGGF